MLSPISTVIGPYEESLRKSYTEAHKRLQSGPPAVLLPARHPQALPSEQPLPAFPVSLEAILRLVSDREGVSIVEMRSVRRTKRISTARMIFYHLTAGYSLSSLQAIGNFVGHRDHTTVLTGRVRLRKRRLRDVMLNDRVKAYEAVFTEWSRRQAQKEPVDSGDELPDLLKISETAA